jgi:hypothetical protein
MRATNAKTWTALSLSAASNRHPRTRLSVPKRLIPAVRIAVFRGGTMCELRVTCKSTLTP